MKLSTQRIIEIIAKPSIKDGVLGWKTTCGAFFNELDGIIPTKEDDVLVKVDDYNTIISMNEIEERYEVLEPKLGPLNIEAPTILHRAEVCILSASTNVPGVTFLWEVEGPATVTSISDTEAQLIINFETNGYEYIRLKVKGEKDGFKSTEYITKDVYIVPVHLPTFIINGPTEVYKNTQNEYIVTCEEEGVNFRVSTDFGRITGKEYLNNTEFKFIYETFDAVGPAYIYFTGTKGNFEITEQIFEVYIR